MSGPHALLAPSSAPQWFYCSGSVMAQQAIPDFDTEASREGDAAHWVVAECLKAWRDTDRAALCSDWLGQVSPNGVIVTEEMCQGGQTYVDDILHVCQQYGALQLLKIEHHVTMPQIHPHHNEGTLDAGLWLPDVSKLYLWDYKFGFGEVPAKNNPQLIDYVAGLVNEIGVNGIADQHIEVVMRVGQPRFYKRHGAVDEWRCTLSDLRGHFNQLNAMGNEALTNPRLSAGPHCRYCKAKVNCSANRKSVYAGIWYVNQPFDIEKLDGRDLAVEYRQTSEMLGILKARLDDVTEALREQVKQGDTSSGLALKASFGNKEWTVPAPQVVLICKQFGLDVAKVGALTPTQVIAKAPKEIKENLEQMVKSISRRPAKGNALVPAEETTAALAFKRK